MVGMSVSAASLNVVRCMSGTLAARLAPDRPRGVCAVSATGSMFGLAYGDALGKPTEFLRLDEIVYRYGPRGPQELPDDALVTDDTQMALSVADALFDQPADAPLNPEPF